MKMTKIATPSERNIAIHRDVCSLGAARLSPSRGKAICQQVERWRAYMLPDWISTCEPPASVLARREMSTRTRVDQPASSNDVNALRYVVYGKILKCNRLANSPPERNSRYERLTRTERRERQKQWRAIAQERMKSRPQEIRAKQNKLIAQV